MLYYFMLQKKVKELKNLGKNILAENYLCF